MKLIDNNVTVLPVITTLDLDVERVLPWSDQCSDRARDLDDLGIKYEALREHAASCEEQCRNYATQWEMLREQRDNARARVAYLEREMNVLRTEKEEEK